jgi:hypothetical protein
MSKTVKEWTSDQLNFQQWLALPAKLRKPKTQRQLADQFGVHEATLSDWKKMPGFRDAVNALALDLVRDDVANIVAALVREAKKGSAQHIKMALEMAGLYTEKLEIDAKLKGYVGISPDEWDDDSAQ